MDDFLSYAAFLENLERVRQAVSQACRQAGRRADEVEILPVTKNHPWQAAQYCAQAGMAQVGENRVQEARQKRAEFLAQGGAARLKWRLIGHLQSNKAKAAAEIFEAIESLDSLPLAQKIDACAAQFGREKLEVLLQVNAGRDAHKFGMDIEEAPAVLEAVMRQCPHLEVRGLMTIAPLDSDLSVARACFARLRLLAERLRAQSGLPLPALSMGMSGDLKEAVAEGSTQIRVGTALFGARDYSR